MARFRGVVKGARGEGSRIGHKNTGLETTCDGWDIGATCSIYYSEAKDTDIITVKVTSGSGDGDSLTLGKFCKDSSGKLTKVT